MRETVPDQEMASTNEQDPRIAKISKAIRVIPDFPKPGTHLVFIETSNGRFWLRDPFLLSLCSFGFCSCVMGIVAE